MNTILEPFLQQYNKMKEILCGKREVRIGTLGPNGTSSERAAKYIIYSLQQMNPNCKYIIELRNDFKDVFKALSNKEIDYALVPAAYEKISEYFWYPYFQNSLTFIYSTPNYGIVSKSKLNHLDKKKIYLATCPAAEKIFNYLMDDMKREYEIEVVTTRSTVEAILSVINNQADIGITNETSYERYKDQGIVFMSKKYSVNIVWSLFENTCSGQKVEV